MISLPIVLAKFGITCTYLIMLIFAALTYMTALIRSDLNLNSNAAATLQEIGQILNHPTIGEIGNYFLILLHFALMSAYLFGFSSILYALFENLLNFTVSQTTIIIVTAMAIALFFLITSETIIQVNKYLFMIMFGILIALIIILFLGTEIEIVPKGAMNIKIKDWATLVPIIFTSFGFQGSIHSMTKFANNNKSIIKCACFWGSLIPALIYVTWTTAILLVVANTDVAFFKLMLSGETIEIGALIEILSKATDSQVIQIIVWGVSIFAILTSILGVGLALLDIAQRSGRIESKWGIIVAIVFAPAVVSIFVPNAFIRILNFAGIILAIIAIIIPVILSFIMKKEGKIKEELLLKNQLLIKLTFAFGLVIILLGIIDLL